MLKIGVLGIGDIAKKAYLPVLSQIPEVELVLCTRNKDTLRELCLKYQIKESYTCIDEFIHSQLSGVFITVATEMHFELSKKILSHGIPLHLDKPISTNFEQCEILVSLAKETQTPFYVGFNRRFAPQIKICADIGNPKLIVYQKNRTNEAADYKTLLFDDFIHVIDTTRFLMNVPIKKITSEVIFTHKKKVRCVIVNFYSDNAHAVCIMNYENGIDEETIEISYDNQKRIIRNLSEIETFENNERITKKTSDWVSTLNKRGFEQMCSAFIQALQNTDSSSVSAEDALVSHRIVNDIYLEHLQE